MTMTRLRTRAAPLSAQPVSARLALAGGAQAGHGPERAAEDTATRALSRPAAPAASAARMPLRPVSAQSAAHSLGYAPDAVRSVLTSPGEPLTAAARADLEPRFGADFGQVRVHRDEAAAQSAKTLSAQAYAAGSHIVFGAGRYAPETSAGRQVLAHELSHVLQQGKGEGGGGLGAQIQRLPTALGDIPEAERRTLRIGTVEVDIAAERLREYFVLLPSGRPGGTRAVPGATNSFGANIPTALQQGLGSVASYCAAETNALPLNSSIEVDLDLTPFAGPHATFRFTYFAHSEGSGRSAVRGDVLLIEQIGAARAAPTPRTAAAGTFAVNGTSFTASGSWHDDDYTVLHEALALLPDAARTGAAGLTFRRIGSPVGGEAGRYLAAGDTIELNNLAFPTATNLRVGERSPAVRTVLHEVGHALDLRSLETAWRAFDAAGQTAGARRTLLAERSASGTRYTPPGSAPDANYEQDQSPGDATPEFRRAVARDGVRRDTTGTRTSTDAGDVATLSGGITRYSETDYQELFAEAFSLYITSPDTLRALRPATFAYFQTRYPRAP
jgi:hypothetical protein